MFKLAFRNIFRHRGRSALTLGAVIFGVMGLMLSGGFVQDIFLQLREATIHSHLGHMQIYEAGYYRYGRRDPYRYMITDPGDLLPMIAGEEDVQLVTRRLRFSGLLNNGKTDLPILAQGVEPAKEAELGSFLKVVQGRPLEEQDRYRLMVGEGVARTLNLRPGDPVTVLANIPAGGLNSLQMEVAGVFRSISTDYDARAIRLPLAAAQELLDTQRVHSLVVLLKDTETTDAVAANLRAKLDPARYELLTWQQLAEFFQKTVALYGRQFLVLQIIILFMVLLGVVNSVNITIYDRTGEFGTLMALGNRGRDIFELVLVENILLGFIGAVLGITLGALAALGISHVGIPMPPPPGMNEGYTAAVRLVPDVMLTAMAVSFLAAVLGSILPAWRVTRMPVVDALRQN